MYAANNQPTGQQRAPGQPGQPGAPAGHGAQAGYEAPSDYTGYTETVLLDDQNGSRTASIGAHLPQSDLLQEILTNKQLRIPKLFYFFFYAAFGSLFPLMAVYFKQMGMNATQVGFLIGLRPFIEIFSAPFWSGLADKFRTGKVMLLASLFSWIVFTCAMNFIRPPASGCVIFNGTNHIIYTPYAEETDDTFERKVTAKGRGKRTLGPVHPALLASEMYRSFGDSHLVDSHRKRREEPEEEETDLEPVPEKPRMLLSQIDPAVRYTPPPGHVVGKSPTSIEYTINYNKDRHAEYVSPAFCSVVYKWEDVKEVFFLLLLLVLLGEFFSAPAITLADQATLSYLGEQNSDLYGRQRMFGSLGWAVSMFIMGMVLDSSTNFPGHPCLPHERERNYKTCFTVFAVLMAAALGVATKFIFDYGDQLPGQNDVNNLQMNPFEASKPKPIFNTAPPINPPPGALPGGDKKFEFIDRWKSAVFAQRTREIPEWLTVFKYFANVRYGAFLFVVWFMGLGMGLVFAFLFWHLQDLGGTPSLFGLASVLNHVSEIAAYCYSVKFIKELGHTRVLCIGLAGNVGRFLYISWLDSAWMVLPFEFIQGITHAAVWAACCSYMTQATEPHMRSQTQAVLQGLHHGFGRGCGAILGGIFINMYGTRTTFFCYGLLSAVVLAIFVYVNYQKTEQGFMWHEDLTGHQVMLDGDHLAPHGVPSAPITRSLSKNNVNPGQDNGNPFGTPAPGYYQQQGGYLNPNQSYQQPNMAGTAGHVMSLVPDTLKNRARLGVLNPFLNIFAEQATDEDTAKKYELTNNISNIINDTLKSTVLSNNEKNTTGSSTVPQNIAFWQQ
ncbi:Major facilitator superfamily domain-containing protein 6 [Halotydeus destructor]|nr:Major facilitator superfamily domain-containing protein 6 [Halotydeus destructor]